MLTARKRIKESVNIAYRYGYAKKKLNFPVIVEITWYEKNKRRDPDNVAFAKKFVLDSLVESGTFPGDGQRYVLGFIDHFRVDSKNPRIEITIHEDNDK